MVSHHWNADQNQDIKIAKKLFENVPKFKYLGTTLKKTNSVALSLQVNYTD
jgi:hypothetical protein